MHVGWARAAAGACAACCCIGRPRGPAYVDRRGRSPCRGDAGRPPRQASTPDQRDLRSIVDLCRAIAAELRAGHPSGQAFAAAVHAAPPPLDLLLQPASTVAARGDIGDLADAVCGRRGESRVCWPAQARRMLAGSCGVWRGSRACHRSRRRRPPGRDRRQPRRHVDTRRPARHRSFAGRPACSRSSSRDGDWCTPGRLPARVGPRESAAWWRPPSLTQ